MLVETDKPFLCSGLYAAVILFFGWITGPFLPALISGAIRFLLASIYFWVLNKLDGYYFVWWIVALVGLSLILL